jgi:hypothetical protein
MKDDGQKAFEGVRDLLSGMAGGFTALGLSAIGADPGAALVVGSSVGEMTKQGGDRFLTRLAQTQARRAEKAAEELFKAIAQDADAIQDVDMRKRRIVEWLQDQEREDVLLEGFRELVDSHDRAVWPALAVMTSEYYSSGRPVDSFFRRVAELLKAITRDDLLAFRNVFNLAITHFPEGGPLEMSKGVDGTLRVCRQAPGKGYEHFIHAPFPPVVEPFERVLLLLKVNGFGQDPPTGRWTGGNPSAKIVFALTHVPDLQRLSKFVEFCD